MNISNFDLFLSKEKNHLSDTDGMLANILFHFLMWTGVILPTSLATLHNLDLDSLGQYIYTMVILGF